jgi:cell wall-associated NlpC family hydrolase
MPQSVLALILPDLQQDAAKVLGALALGLLIAFAFAISCFTSLFGMASPGGSIATAQPQAEAIPADQLVVMQTAAASCGLPWQVLAAIADVESSYGKNMATSSAGAIGYGQFLPSTWAAYGNGGNAYDYRDAIPAMAHYLCANGGASDLRRAIYAYNHGDWYVAEVLGLAARYGYLTPGSSQARVIDLARAQIGRPYVWGGASPLTSFDCSGLVQWAFGQLGVHLPRTAQEQFDATARLTPDQLQPGDLVYSPAPMPQVTSSRTSASTKARAEC